MDCVVDGECLSISTVPDLEVGQDKYRVFHNVWKVWESSCVQPQEVPSSWRSGWGAYEWTLLRVSAFRQSLDGSVLMGGILYSGLHNNCVPETFQLRHTTHGHQFPCNYIKIGLFCLCLLFMFIHWDGIGTYPLFSLYGGISRLSLWHRAVVTLASNPGTLPKLEEKREGTFLSAPGFKSMVTPATLCRILYMCVTVSTLAMCMFIVAWESDHQLFFN